MMPLKYKRLRGHSGNIRYNKEEEQDDNDEEEEERGGGEEVFSKFVISSRYLKLSFILKEIQ